MSSVRRKFSRSLTASFTRWSRRFTSDLASTNCLYSSVFSVCWQYTTHCTAVRQSIFNYSNAQLRPVIQSLSVNAIKTLVQAFISCRLDYCNSLLFGISDGLLVGAGVAGCNRSDRRPWHGPPATAPGLWPADMLHRVERRQHITETTTVRVSRRLKSDVKVPANHNRTCIDDQCL